MRPKYGTVSEETGLVFWARQGGRDIWLDKERFAKRKERAAANRKVIYWKNVEEERRKLREYHHQNKEMKSASFKKWAEANKPAIRNKRLERVYGLSNEKYIEMFDEQHGLCAICGEEQQGVTKEGNTRFLCVDHCHKTGKVRQLLCVKCNTGIGQLNDDTGIMMKAIAYLDRHQKQS
jgi:hypothetical protein